MYISSGISHSKLQLKMINKMPSSSFHGSVIPMAQWLPVSGLDAQHGKRDYLTRTRHKVNGALLKVSLRDFDDTASETNA